MMLYTNKFVKNKYLLKMKKILILILVLPAFVFANNTDLFFNKTDKFLKKYVIKNRVDYQSIKSNKVDIDELMNLSKGIQSAGLETDTFKAFWINTYNICVIKAISDVYPVKSPMDIKGLFDTMKFNVGQQSLTLNDIEYKMLIEIYNDPRVHFALVCGAVGCPPFLNGCYFPTNLDNQLNEQTKTALNNPSFMKVDAGTKKMELSQIFEWYKKDFITSTKDEIDFINRYRTEKLDKSFMKSYYTYDWTLNNLN